MGKKFKMVIETDENGEERPVKIEVTSKHVIRKSKAFKWEKQTALKAITDVTLQKKLIKADIVTATTKSGYIEWKVKKGQKLIDVIEEMRWKINALKIFYSPWQKDDNATKNKSANELLAIGSLGLKISNNY